ncbi:beta-N-acetylglucosaminidase domain-containing protein [Pedobacter immunditicola]|uniref:beta-N-acetylglucosaminidase domain-containing protein n=1 Tax=Pedobacter immunditicola TaxID=3133440 RepID=UPI0030AAA3A0
MSYKNMTTYYIKRYFTLSLILISTIAFAQQGGPVIYPTPQQAIFQPGTFVQVESLNLRNLKLETGLHSLLGSVFKLASNANSIPLQIGQLKARKFKSGAYQLSIMPAAIKITADDDRGVFYALQSLLQLAKREGGNAISLPQGTINDFPDLPFRGTVEGFYGEPWSHEDRISQFRFYGKMKLNTYIYGPKDDPYHSSPHWRQPYPEKEAARIKELVAEANKNRVDFVWAIHPGKDIKWTKADSIAVLQKFDAMYGLGVRSFAVFFDDISGDGTHANKQAGLLNYIQRQFVKKKKDVANLIMCPTEYNKGWSDPKPGTYLDILGAALDPDIYVMWTGNTVIADVTKEGLEWVNKRIKRPAFFWWNFPVSDYVRDHLLMGPAYGLDTNAREDMSGFVANPMDKAEASKVALFGAADYAWNIRKYNSQANWEAANQYVMPEATAAFRLFNSHNSDLGPNGHRYRRAESVEIEPVISAFSKGFSAGLYPAKEAQEISAEFDRIIAAPLQIRSNSKNLRLVEQISPWLQQFSLLGHAGSEAMKSVADWQNKAYPVAWNHYLETERYLDSMVVLDQTLNQNPYQPGVETGSLVLIPFVKSVFEKMGQYFVNQGQDNFATKNAIEKQVQTALLTNTLKLKSQPLQLTNATVAISPVLEVVKLNPGEYLGVQINPLLKITDLQFHLESANLFTWGRLETSSDGRSWMPLLAEQKRGKGTTDKFNADTKMLRFLNFSDKEQSVFLKLFKLNVAAVSELAETEYAFDQSITTFSNFSKDKALEISLPKEMQKSGVRILARSNGADYSISGLNKRGKKIILYQGKGSYVEIEPAQMKKIKGLYFSTSANVPMRIYEINK